MNISWGTKIALLYIGFVIMIIALVSGTFFNRSELVAEDYYQQETVFQKRLDAIQAANALNEPLCISQKNDSIILHFPAVFAGHAVKGTIHFYAPSDASADRIFSFDVPAGGEWGLGSNKLMPLRYEAQVSWTSCGKDYYHAIDIKVQ